MFFTKPGSTPATNIAYWGPAVEGPPQKTLSFNMGSKTNVEQLDFKSDSSKATAVKASVKEPLSGRTIPLPSLGSLQSLDIFSLVQEISTSGLTLLEATKKAQAIEAASRAETVEAQGELNTLQYGSVLNVGLPVLL